MNPNVSGKSTSSQPKEDDSGSSSDSDTDIEYDFCRTDTSDSETEEAKPPSFTMSDVFPSTSQVYGVEVKAPKKTDTITYKTFAKIGWNAGHLDLGEPDEKRVHKETNLIQKSVFSLDSSVSVDPPNISRMSRDVYKLYIKIGKHGPQEPSKDIYKKYVSALRL